MACSPRREDDDLAITDPELARERALQAALPVIDGPGWRRLRATEIRFDPATQMYSASFPASVRAMEGRPLVLEGYMLPLSYERMTTHFLISPYTPVCPYHPPAEPDELAEAMLIDPVEAGYHRVRVDGTLRLVSDPWKGLFFRLEAARARVVEAIDGRRLNELLSGADVAPAPGPSP